MRRGIGIVFVLCLLITGCGSSTKDPKDVSKILEDKFDMYFNFNYYDDLYDSDTNCYDSDGEKKNCDRISDAPEETSIKLLDNGDFSISATMDKKGKLTYFSISPNSDDLNGFRTYAFNLKKKTEHISVYDYDDNYNTENCNYVLSGKLEDTETKKCKGSQLEDAKEVKENIDKYLSDLDITRDDLESFFAWYYKEFGKEVKSTVAASFKEQKDLTADEVKTILEDNEYTVKNSDKSIFISDKYDWHTYSSTLTDGKSELILYSYNAYSGEEADYPMTLGYYVDLDKFLSLSKGDDSCSYNPEKEKIDSDSKCNEEQTDNADMLYFTYKNNLVQMKLTSNDLVTLFNSYK